MKITAKLMSTIPEGSLQVKSYNSDSVKLYCVDINLFRIVQKYLSKISIDFHTVPLPEERYFKIVIKELLKSTTETEVAEELRLLRFEVTNVRQFANATRKFPIHMVTLPANPFNKEIFNLNTLIYISITVESYKNNKPAQWFNCQRFGYSSKYCGYAPRYVKCVGSHLTKDCLKTPKEDPKCTNCTGLHTAIYKQCPTLLELIVSKRSYRPNTTRQHQHIPPTSNENQLFITSKTDNSISFYYISFNNKKCIT